MQKNCLESNYFFKYKKERVEILSDKPTFKQTEEPFHKKYLREEREKEERLRLLEAKKKALIMGNYWQAQQIESELNPEGAEGNDEKEAENKDAEEEVRLSLDKELISKQDRLSMWI